MHAKRLFLGVAGLLLAGALPMSGPAAAQAPSGFDQVMTFMSDGVWDPSVPHPEVPGCAGIFCDGLWFQQNIMQRTAAEIDAREAMAKAWFVQRFGIDVDDPANSDRVAFGMFMADPRWNYRAVFWSGRLVPQEGFEVRDGGWSIVVTDPGGYTLGGELSGIHVPMDSMAVFGDYNVLVTNPAGNNVQEVRISYRSNSFMVINELVELIIDCQISASEFESGIPDGTARGMAAIEPGPQPGTIKMINRNIVALPEP